jgi:transcriptional regulator with XRE-family HTH domain
MPQIIKSGADIKEWRHRLGLTQAQAAAELRVKPQSVKNLECGYTKASPTLLRLAELLEQLSAVRNATTEPEPEPDREKGAKIDPDVASEPIIVPEPPSPLTTKIIQALDDLSIEIPSAAVPMLVSEIQRVRFPKSSMLGAHDESCRSMDTAREWKTLVGKPGLEELAILISGFIE